MIKKVKSMKKRKAPGDILNLPDPKSVKPKKRAHTEKCEECKGPLILNRTKGYGYCEACKVTVAIPVAVILSSGPHRGKFVYLEEGLRRELYEEYNEDDLEDELEADLKDKGFFVMKLIVEE